MARVTSVLFRATLRALNRIGEGVERVGIGTVSLDDRELRAVACRETGLSDSGDEDFREPLSQLLHALESEARLTLVGRIVARVDIVGLLANRLRLKEDRRRHPEIGEERIRRPVFIVGLPRSGSTLLHHLLAQDPASRTARAWEVMEPSPPPEKTCYETDPRIARAARRLRWFDRLVPDFKRIHPLGAELPLECIVIMSASFVSPRFLNYHVPSYQTWLAAADLRPAYEFHRRFLQHLQWRAPGDRWVLKAPSHVFGFEPLFATYPDAVVVQTHRDPVTVLASVASKTLVLRGAFTDRLDPTEIGAEETQRWSSGLELAMQARQDGRREGRFLDVRYQDLLRDPMATVRRIYDRFGMAFTVAAEARMQRFLATHPKDQHGPHRYSLETFGLDARDLAHRFKSYCERFGLEHEVERSHNIHWQATGVRK